MMNDRLEVNTYIYILYGTYKWNTQVCALFEKCDTRWMEFAKIVLWIYLNVKFRWIEFTKEICESIGFPSETYQHTYVHMRSANNKATSVDVESSRRASVWMGTVFCSVLNGIRLSRSIDRKLICYGKLYEF